MTNITGPKLSISLYCFSYEIHSGKLTIADSIKKVAELGAEGVEIVNTQHLEGWPNPSANFKKMFKDEIEKNNLQLSSYGGYTDTGIRTDGTLTDEEMKGQLVHDLTLAEELGFPLIRIGPNTPMEVIKQCLPLAEGKKIKLGIEIHPPLAINHPMFEMIFDVVRKASSEYLGFVPDFSCWATKIPDALVEYFTQQGFPEEPIRQITDSFNVGVDLQTVKDQAHAMGAPPEADDLIDLAYHLVVKGTPEDLDLIMPYVNHIHAKFWRMENGIEPAIPYESLIPIIKKSGYSRFICSEFEGYVLSGISGVEQAREHQAMLRKLLSI